MRRLGMNEESEAVLARAQRQAGSRISAVRTHGSVSSPGADGSCRPGRAPDSPSLANRTRRPDGDGLFNGRLAIANCRALECLAQAGKLKELIATVEQQIERTPQASQLYETLAEYYQAAGDVQKLLDLQAKIVSLRPDDADLRYRYGQELYRRGKLKEACDEYLVVVKKQPQLLRNRYWEVQQAFQRCGARPIWSRS